MILIFDYINGRDIAPHAIKVGSRYSLKNRPFSWYERGHTLLSHADARALLTDDFVTDATKRAIMEALT
jgi:hypothetical protein